MFKPELWQSHDEYRTIVNSLGKKLSRNNPRYQFDAYSKERQKLLSLNLDPLMDYLPNSISLACLCGFSSVEDLPPLGSYYDLMNRLWSGSRDPYARSALLPAGKNGKKPRKTIGNDGKLAEESPDTFSTRHTVDLIRNGSPASDNPEAVLQEIFSLLAVLPSIRLGLIDTGDLTVSGDGTAVVSHTSPNGRHLSSCTPSCPFRRTCGRHYSDPDAGWGWDSLNFLYTIDDFGRHSFGLSPKNICLDSAHDNLPTYELLEHWDINAFIDINGRTKSSENAPDDITFDKEGHPLCRAGHNMCSWGNDPVKQAHKYRCPLKCGRIRSCPHEKNCSKGSYGRTVYIKHHADLRFHPRVPRDSDIYKETYSKRTACERVNDRVLNDYCLQHLKIRGKDHFSFWTMLIGICIHLDARYKAGCLN